MKKATKINLTLLALALSANGLYAQQGFGTNQPSKVAVIDMQSESKGLLIPRVSLTSLTVFSPVRGETATNVGKTNSLLVYNTATVGATIKPGYYYWTTDGTTPNSSWKRLLANDDASALALVGDVTGTLGATVVGKIQGTPVANTVPTNNQILTYNGTAWTPTTITPATISGKGTLTTQGGIEFTASTNGTDKLLGDATIQIANGGVTAQKLTAGTGTAGRVAVADANGVVTYTNAVPSSSVSGQNVTAGSTKVTLGGTPAGAALKAFSIDVSEANLSLNNIGGTLNADKITPGANGQVLTTNSTGNTVWADKASLITSVSNISNINTLTTTVNGVIGAGVNIVNSNLLSLNGTNQLVSTVNGVASTGLNLGPAVTAATTHTLGVSGNTLTSTVNGVAPTASILNNFSNTLSGTTLSTNANGLAASIDLAPAIKAGETLTSLSQNTTSGVITYTPERGTASTANVLSTTTGNLITYDNGAFLNAATVKSNQQNTIVQGTGAISVPTAVTAGNNTTYTVGVNTATSTALGVVRPGSGLSINAGVLSVDATTSGIGKTLTGSGITVNGGTSLANTVLTDVTLGIADNAITSTKIANNAVTVGKLPAGASATTFLRGDGTWVTPTDNNTTYTGSTSVTLNGTSFERAALTGDVTAPANSNVTTIANNAITAGKISDDAVTAAKINPDVAGNGLTQATDGSLQVNAQNGINVNNDLLKLGGTLTENTTLTNSTFDLTLATTTAGTTGKLKVTGLDKTKVQATINTGTTTGITEHVLAVGSDNVVKALKATMPKFFYMPSIIVPIANSQFTAINGTAGESFTDGTRTGVLNLYERYKAQFGTTGTTTQPSSPSAPQLPVLPASELHYYVTWYDTTIFQSVSLDATGKMTYVVRTGVDVTVGSFMNIVFAVKEG